MILPVLVYHQNFSSIEAAPISMSLVGVSAMITLLSQRTSWKEWWSKDLITFIGGSLFMIYLTKWLLMYLKTNVLATKEGVEQLDHFIMLLFIPIIFFSAWHAWPRKSFTQNTTVWNRSKGWGWGMLTGSLAGILEPVAVLSLSLYCIKEPNSPFKKPLAQACSSLPSMGPSEDLPH